MEKTVVELFAGVGGFRCGLNNVQLEEDKVIENGNWEFVWANQWEPSTKTQDAFNCYVKRFGESLSHSNMDISLVDKTEIPDHTLLCGGFPCLTGDSLILTTGGLKKIIDVKPGDFVLSHDNQFHKVTELLKQGLKPTYIVSTQNNDSIRLTDNHRLYVRKYKNNKLGKPEWKSVGELMEVDNGKPLYENYLICNAINQVEKVPDKRGGLDFSEEGLWYLVGKFLSNGTLMRNHQSGKNTSLVIYCDHEHAKKLMPSIPVFFTYTVSKMAKLYKFVFNIEEFVSFIELFGTKPSQKKLPGFVFELHTNLIKALITGFMEDVEKKDNNGNTVITIKNKVFAHGLSQCIQKAYKVPVLMEENDIMFNLETNNFTNVIYEDNSFWYPFVDIKPTGKSEKVFDLTVEATHSFTANSCVVHNCQDYSVARSLSNEKGIEGKKGVLWWQIAEILETKQPSFVLLENVDRLLISPSKQRGRDFAIMLRTFYDLGYAVQWQVINAADYGFPQKRKRVFIFACKKDTKYFKYLMEKKTNLGFADIVGKSGIFSKTFSVTTTNKYFEIDITQYTDVVNVSETYKIPFFNSGCMLNGIIYTMDTKSVVVPDNEKVKLKDIIMQQPVAQNHFLNDTEIERFRYLKGTKRIPRVKPNGEPYIYSEGQMPFPDNVEVAARTMLTSERTVNRSTHVVKDICTGELRFLTPVEAERINCFPDNWTNTGMSEKRRYFMMGNALVVGIIKKLSSEIEEIVNKEN